MMNDKNIDMMSNNETVLINGISVDQEVLNIMGITNLDDMNISVSDTGPEELAIFN